MRSAVKNLEYMVIKLVINQRLFSLRRASKIKVDSNRNDGNKREKRRTSKETDCKIKTHSNR